MLPTSTPRPTECKEFSPLEPGKDCCEGKNKEKKERKKKKRCVNVGAQRSEKVDELNVYSPATRYPQSPLSGYSRYKRLLSLSMPI